MATGILFDSANRLLGSSIGDLSLFGGQAGLAVSVHAAAEQPDDPAPLLRDASATSAGLAPATDPGTGEPVHGTAIDALASDAGAAPTLFSSVGATDGLHVLDAAHVAPAIDSAPSGPIITQALFAAPSGASTVADQAGDAVEAPAALAGEAPLPLAEAPHDTALGTADTLLASAAGAVTATTVLTPVLDVAQGTLIGAVDGVTAAATGTLSPLLDATQDTLATTLGAVGGVVAGVTEAAADTLSPLLDTAHDTLTATLGAAGDTLHGLAGSDPLGGVATLVSLVSVTDMFDLHPVNAPPSAEIADGAGLGVLDALVGDVGFADSLLGVAHDGDHGLGLDHGLDLHHALGL